MDNKELKEKMEELIGDATAAVKNPLLPKQAREAMGGLVLVICELVDRELERNAKS